jgi:hypothetical protein
MFDPLETKGNIQQPEIISSVDLLDMNNDTKVHTIDYLKSPIDGSPYSCKFICGNGSWFEILLRSVEFMEILSLPFLPGKHVSCNRKELLVELAEMLSFPLLSEISTKFTRVWRSKIVRECRIQNASQRAELIAISPFPLD